MKKILKCLLAMLFFIDNNSIAQVSTNFNNDNIISNTGRFEKNYLTSIDIVIPAKNIDSLLSKEKGSIAQSNELKPFKLADPTKVNLDIPKLTNWTYDKEFAYCKFTLKLSGALSSSISFDKFYLPKNTELFVYNLNGRMITGPVTEKENNKTGIWGSWVYQGEIITIEIKTPIVSMKELILHSDNVAYGYKEIYKSIKVGGFGTSGPCNINIICPLGNGWEGERNSVSTILSSNGGEFCTGSLVMNTCGTNIPYYLTANHCFNGNSNVAGWRFAFQAWSTTCPNPGVNTNGVMYNGATLRSRNAPSDFCLVELNQTPPANSGLHYAGWNRSSTPAQNATCIHHPSGDLMKISQANNPVTIASAFSTINQHWRANWSPQNNGAGQTVTAITEGGSSGSPLFDQNRRIIGQLHGGPSACNGTQLWDFYGRFDLSWTGGGTNATRLSNWLDPTNTGMVSTNTTNVADITPTIIGNNSICSSSPSQVYSLNVLPCNTTNTWNITDGNGGTTTATVFPLIGNSTTVTIPSTLTSGNLILTATLSNGTVISKPIFIGFPGFGASYKNGITDGNPVGIYFPSQGSNNIFNDVCIGYGFPNVYVDAQPYGINNVTWSVPNGYATPAFSLQQQNGNRAYFNWNYGGLNNPPGYLQASVSNSCGSFSQIFAFEQVNCGTPGGDPCNLAKGVKYFTISPNPATNNINIGIGNKPPPVECNNLKALNTSNGIVFSLVNVYNNTGTLVKSYKTKNAKTASLQIANLMAGSYLVEIIQADYVEKQQIIIQK